MCYAISFRFRLVGFRLPKSTKHQREPYAAETGGGGGEEGIE